jgi:enoyl-CoA hydratase
LTECLVHYARQDKVGVLTLLNPPVNALSLAVRAELLSVLDRANEDGGVRALVLKGAGRGFSAGGDVREFGTPAVTASPRLTWDVHPAIEALSKPIVAAMHGFAIGGGLETALACHDRVAAADTIIALPEVTLGVIPLSGTQRLPRVVSLSRSLEVILTGAKFRADTFASERLFGRIVTDTSELDLAAHSLALQIADDGPPFPLVRRLPILTAASDWQLILGATEAGLDREAPSTACCRALEAVVAALEASEFDQGLSSANAMCEELLNSDRVKRLAQRFT